VVKVIYEFDVAMEKQEEYLKVTREKIKPLWESKGCQSYDVWQVADSKTRFIKEALFENESVMRETSGLKDLDSVKEIFRSFAENASRRVSVQKI